MNVFVLDQQASIAANYHCNIHVNKMILESAQLLSTAERLKHNNKKKVFINGRQKYVYIHPTDTIKDGKLIDKELYLDTHHNHPCAIALRKNLVYQQYTINLAHTLLEIFNAPHACRNTILSASTYLQNNNYKHSSDYFPKAMPTQFISSCPVISYRKYYAYKLQQWAVGSDRQREYAKKAYANKKRPYWLDSNHNYIGDI